MLSTRSVLCCRYDERSGLHLRVKNRDRSFNDGHALVEDLERVEVLAPRNDRLDFQRDVLRLHDSRKGVRQRLLGFGRNHSSISGGCEVAHGLRWIRCARNIGGCQESAQGDKHVDLFLLVVGNAHQAARGPTIDHLDAKDLGIGKGDIDVHVQRLLHFCTFLARPLLLAARLGPLAHVVPGDIFDVGRRVWDIFNLRLTLAIEFEMMLFTWTYGNAFSVLSQDGKGADGSYSERREAEGNHGEDAGGWWCESESSCPQALES